MAVVINGNGTVTGVTAQDELNVDSNTLVVDSTNNRVGIGTSSPASKLDATDTSSGGTTYALRTRNSGTATGTEAGLAFTTNTSNGGQASCTIKASATSSTGNLDLVFHNSSSGSLTERMRIDSSGNLLVAKTTNDTYSNTVGHELQSNGMLAVTRDGNKPLILNRLTSDGEIASFRKDGTTVGQINSINGVYMAVGTGNTGLIFNSGQNSIYPWDMSTNAKRDNAIDMGYSSARFDDIYATNGTIQTSDQNEKQQIASLTDAEMNVAKRLSALFKTFKWNSSVEENGDNARTHTGIIAQDMQQAFTDEGLDAGNYAMFISSTWWEKEISVDAVEAVDAVYETVEIPAEYDDEGNEISPATTEQRLVEEAVEGKDAYTYIDTKEEATEGYTERTRLGVRYPELFAFISAYNDQRFSDLETRIEALENA